MSHAVRDRSDVFNQPHNSSRLLRRVANQISGNLTRTKTRKFLQREAIAGFVDGAKQEIDGEMKRFMVNDLAFCTPAANI